MYLVQPVKEKKIDVRCITPLCNNVIGEGRYSKIKKGTIIKKDGKYSFCKIPVALKKKYRRDEEYHDTVQESNIILGFKKVPFIINLIAIRYDREEIILALELCNPQRITHFTDLFNDDPSRYFAVLYIGAAMISAVGALHKYNYVHCDIKCKNIVLSKTGVPKLIDFGLSSKLENAASNAGTYGFMAPELKHHNASFKSDSFSLGICIGEMLIKNRSSKIYGEYYENLHHLKAHMSEEKFHGVLEANIVNYYKLDEESINELPEELFKVIYTELVLDFVQVKPENRRTILEKIDLNIVQKALGLQPTDINQALAEQIDTGVNIAKNKLREFALKDL